MSSGYILARTIIVKRKKLCKQRGLHTVSRCRHCGVNE